MMQKAVEGKYTNGGVKALAVEYHLTQAFLDKKEYTLYRGIGGSYAEKAFQTALKTNKNIVLNSRGADSWSDSRENAEGFGEFTIKLKIPKEQIFSSWRTNKELEDMDEKEFIVTAPKGKIVIDRNKRLGHIDRNDMYSSNDAIEIDVTDDKNANWLHKKDNPKRMNKKKA